MIYLLAGHHRNDPGAISNGYRESDLTMDLRNMVSCSIRSKGIGVVSDDDTDSLSAVIGKIKSNDRDIICDIHFNAAAPSATGIEVFVPMRSTALERSVAGKISRRGAAIMGIKNRGVKDESLSARGKLAIMNVRGVNLLIEVCFITNRSDMDKYIANKLAIADMIAEELIAADK